MYSPLKFLVLVNLLCGWMIFFNPLKACAQQSDLSYDFIAGMDMKPEPKTVEKLVCKVPLTPADSNSTIVLAVKENTQGTALLSATYQLVKQQGVVYAVGEKDSYLVVDDTVDIGLRLANGREAYMNKLIVVTITNKTGKSYVKTVLLK